MPALHIRASALTLPLLVSFGACATITPAPERGSAAEGKLITAEMIKQSGATNAWDAIKRSGTHLSFRENSRGEPSSLTYRGRSSIYLSTAPIVVLDGARVSDFTALRDIPAHTISQIRIYTGITGTKYYGTGGGNGVIFVVTKTSSG